jgi:sigma-E factor negative regulatory protein RseC
MKAKVHNPVGAQVGDVVELYLDNRAIYYSAIILYGMPLIGLFTGAILGMALGRTWFESESLSAAICGIAGVCSGLFLAVVAGNSTYAKQHFTPTITQVITPVVFSDGVLPK